jgi:PiT family inorganic phosphate transporter
LDTTTIALGIGYFLSFLMAVALGGNDAATPCDTSVGARVISIRNALILFAIFTSVGALTQGYMVMKTIGRGIVPAIDLLGVLITVSVAFAWIMFCNFYGLEISVTHSITGSVLGYGIAAYGIGRVNWSIMTNIIVSWITSPIFAMFMAYSVYKLLARMIRGKNSLSSRIMPILLIAALCYSAYAFGTNDIANATGVYVTISQIIFGGLPEQNIMFILAAFGSIGVAIGGFLLGARVIGTVAFRITRLDPVSGFAAELANAFVVHMFTTIPYMLIGYGIPISTSIAGVGSVIGVGLAMYRSAGVNKRTVLKLFMAWIGTVTITAAASYILYTLIAPITGPILEPKT